MSWGGSWVNLTNFSVGDNRLSGTLPESYAGWRSLKSFSVAGNSLHGTLPAAYSRWGPTLRSLHIERNQFSGVIPMEYGRFTAVASVFWFENMLTGQLPTQLNGWTSVVEVWGYDNDHTGTLPPEYESWRVIDTFKMSSNRITGSLPPSYSAWTRVTMFVINNNSLSGTLSPEYSRWSVLWFFQADDNHVDGSLPHAFAAWNAIVEFRVAANNMSGTLPAAYSAWKKVAFFDIRSNCISGEIPSSYFGVNGMTSLATFSASANRLSGTIPSQLSQSQLQAISLSDNCLTGTVPPLPPTTMLAILSNNSYLNTSKIVGVFLFVLSVCFTTSCDSPRSTYNAFPKRLCNIPEQLVRSMATASRNDSNILTSIEALSSDADANTCFTPAAPPTPQPSLPQATASHSVDIRAPTQYLIAVSVVSGGFDTSVVGLRRLAFLAHSDHHCDGGSVAHPIDVTNSPLQLTLGDEPGSQHRGAVVGNVVLWIAMAIVLTVVVSLFRRLRSLREPWLATASRARCPGVCVIAALMLLQQTVVSSTILQGLGTPLDLFVGIGGLSCVLIGLTCLTWFVVNPQPTRFCAIPRASRVRASGPQWRRLVAALVAERVEWIPQRGRAAFAAAFAPLYRSCNRRCHWWIAADMTHSILSGIAASVPTATTSACAAQRWTMVVLSAASLAASVWLQPRHRRLPLINALLASSMETVITVCVALRVDPAVTDGLAFATAIVSVALIVLTHCGVMLLNASKKKDNPTKERTADKRAVNTAAKSSESSFASSSRVSSAATASCSVLCIPASRGYDASTQLNVVLRELITLACLQHSGER